MNQEKTKQNKKIFIIIGAIVLGIVLSRIPGIIMEHNYNNNWWNKAIAYREAFMSAGFDFNCTDIECGEDNIVYYFENKDFEFQVSLYEDNIGIDPIYIDGPVFSGISFGTKKGVDCDYSSRKQDFERDKTFNDTIVKEYSVGTFNENDLDSYFYIYKLNDDSLVVLLSPEGDVMGGVCSLNTVASSFGKEEHYYSDDDNYKKYYVGSQVDDYKIIFQYGQTDIYKETKLIESNKHEILTGLDLFTLDTFCDIMGVTYSIDDDCVNFKSK